nr:hypothetical protein [uncultured Acetatifactor sp.]
MKEKKNVRTMDIILAVIAVFLLLFIVVMIWLYYQTGAIPDTLCTCVFAVCGGECGVMGWIKTTKERQRERSFELEDREHNEKIQKEGL